MTKKYQHLNLPPLVELDSETTEGRRLYCLPDGTKLPSVTTVLGHFGKEHLHKWRARIGAEEAARQTRVASVHGTKLHAAVERILKNESDILTEGYNSPLMQQALYDLQPYLHAVDNIHYIEAPLYSRQLRIAGRVDLIAEFRGVPAIIDFKTSTKRKKTEWITHYFEQATAYALMYEECTGFPIEFIVVMMVSPEGPQVWVKRKQNFIKSLTDKILQYNIDMLA